MSDGRIMHDPVIDAVVHSQKIAQRIGANNMAVEVYGWAIKHAVHIPAPALKELMDILTGDDR